MPLPRSLCSLTVVSLLLAGASISPADEQATEPVFSGPQPGETLPAFKVRGVYGEAVGKELDFVAEAGEKPLVLVFVHERTRPAFGVVRALLTFHEQRKQDRNLRDKDELVLGVVWLTADPTETGNWLRIVERHLGADAPTGISLEGVEGPGAYGLNRDVAMTILVAKQGRVTANFALVQPSVQADVPKVLEAIVRVAGGKVPDLESLGGPMRPAARPAAGLPDELAALVRKLIRKDADEEQVTRAARELEAHFEKHENAGAQVGAVARRIIDSGKLDDYGTPKAREHLKAWADKYAPADRKRPESRSAEGAGQKDG